MNYYFYLYYQTIKPKNLSIYLSKLSITVEHCYSISIGSYKVKIYIFFIKISHSLFDSMRIVIMILFYHLLFITNTCKALSHWYYL